MQVQSIAEAINYIKATCATGMNEMGEQMKEIMKAELMEQIYADHEPSVYERTGQLENTPNIVEIDQNSVTVEFQDNGDWESAITGEPFFPLEGWEHGKVWKSRSNTGFYTYYEPTTIMQESEVKCKQEIPEAFKKYLISKGLNVL